MGKNLIKKLMISNAAIKKIWKIALNNYTTMEIRRMLNEQLQRHCFQEYIWVNQTAVNRKHQG